ncbi:succinyl-CoA synthetase beta subunit [Sinorhizobium fredii]|uniref:ATP-grasp domain-containing protein n=1 Tax=Rhizobium fredii TaxID=380 RepID=UPI003517F19B
MQLTGMLYGSRLLSHVDFPASEVLGPDAGEDAIQDLIARHGLIFVKPVFRGGVGKKGKAGLIGKARDLKTALAEKERLYFAEHRHGNAFAKANGVTFEAGIPAEHEVYFAIADDTHFRAPTLTLTHRGGVDIEDLDKSDIATVPFEALTGLKAFVVANALTDIGAPREIISPLVQHLPKLWELMHHYGMTTLELNPIRMRPGRDGRLTPVACDFKCGFDRDDPRVARLGLPDQLFAADVSAFEQEVNQLRTHQGQSDVFVINEAGTILAPTFGGGANSLVTEVLGEAAIISSDFGGNPPYEKMKAVAAICYRHFLKRTNVLFVIGGKSNNCHRGGGKRPAPRGDARSDRGARRQVGVPEIPQWPGRAAVARRDPRSNRHDDRLGAFDAQAHQPADGGDVALVPAALRGDGRRDHSRRASPVWLASRHSARGPLRQVDDG